jgi:hypothetical protein
MGPPSRRGGFGVGAQHRLERAASNRNARASPDFSRDAPCRPTRPSQSARRGSPLRPHARRGTATAYVRMQRQKEPSVTLAQTWWRVEREMSPTSSCHVARTRRRPSFRGSDRGSVQPPRRSACTQRVLQQRNAFPPLSWRTAPLRRRSLRRRRAQAAHVLRSGRGGATWWRRRRGRRLNVFHRPALAKPEKESGGGGNRTRVRGRTGLSVYKRRLALSFTRRPVAADLPTG